MTKLDTAVTAAREVYSDLGHSDLSDAELEAVVAEALGAAGVREAEVYIMSTTPTGNHKLAARERIRKNGGNHQWLQR